MKCALTALAAVGVAALSFSATQLTGAAQPAGTRPPEGRAPGAQPPADQQGGVAMFGKLIETLADSPGCLGVETARTGSQKNVVFAWFKDKAATLAWYNHPMHQGFARQAFGPAEQGYEPLAHIPDDSGPLMVIASITFGEAPKFEGVNIPISQIAIEIYTPAPGGLHLGGRFAPETVKVEGLRDETPRTRPG